MSKKKSMVSLASKHVVGVILFALVVGLIMGFYSSLFLLNSDWKPAVMYTDEHAHDDTTIAMDDHSHDDVEAHSDDTHMHDLFEINEQIAPSIELQVLEDSKSGYNLRLITSNFVFSPEFAGEAATAGQGHAHVYVDGEKVGRIYSEYYYLGDLPTGEHTISVTLNTDDHADYALNGVVIGDEQTIVVE